MHEITPRRPRPGRPLAQFVIATLIFMAPLLLATPLRGSGDTAWQPIGLRGQRVRALTAVNYGGEQILYAETAIGLWRMNAHAAGLANWERIDAALPRTVWGGPALAAWRVSPSRPQRLYALTGRGAERQLFRSDDGGQTWALIGPAPGQTARPALLILPGSDATDQIIIATGERAQRSSDGGATWAPGGVWPDDGLTAAEEPLQALLGDPSMPERLFALAGTNRLWLSESNGLAWRAAPIGGEALTALAIAPSFGVRIWAAFASGLAFSADNGETWQRLATPGAVVALRPDPRVGETVYAALRNGQVYRTTNNGGAWLALGAPRASRITELALDGDARATLYAATADGVWARPVTPSQPTPAPTATETPQPSTAPTRPPTHTATRTLTPTVSPTATATLTATRTGGVTPPLPTATATRRPTRTPLPTHTATATPEPIPTETRASAAGGRADPVNPTSPPPTPNPR